MVSFDAEDGLDYSGVSRYIPFTSVFIARVLTAASQKIIFNPFYGLLEYQRTITTLSKSTLHMKADGTGGFRVRGC